MASLSMDPVLNELDAARKRAASKRHREKVETAGQVYFARRGTLVKIGFTTDWKKRRSALESLGGGSFDEVVLVRGNFRTEKEYHNRFADHRDNGEWFKLVPEIRAEMIRLAAKRSA
jgi:hypothetical protein